MTTQPTEFINQAFNQPTVTDPALNPLAPLTPPAVPAGFDLLDDDGEFEHPERPDAVLTTDPAMPWTFYGVPISTCGEDGDLIALGHVKGRRFIAAANALGRELGCTPYGERAAELDDAVSETWVVFHAPPTEPELWWCWQVEEGREGAVPVTWWSA